MRTILTLLLGVATATALAARADDDTPTAAEQQAMTAAKLLQAKNAAIDPNLHPDARVAVKFESLSDPPLTALAKYPQVGAIQALDGTKCTEKGLAALKGLPHLRRLVLNKSGVTDKRLAAIAECKQLRALVIPESTVTDAGLSVLPKLARLQALDLSDDPRITDKGMAHIKTLERLEVLYLNKTSITDKGLFELKPLEGLRSLSVGGSKVTAAAAEKFPEEMPNLRVVRH